MEPFSLLNEPPVTSLKVKLRRWPIRQLSQLRRVSQFCGPIEIADEAIRVANELTLGWRRAIKQDPARSHERLVEVAGVAKALPDLLGNHLLAAVICKWRLHF